MSAVVVLWAVSDRFPTPSFVAAYPDGLLDASPNEIARRRARDEAAYASYFDADFGPWRFFTTDERLATPEVPVDAGEELIREPDERRVTTLRRTHGPCACREWCGDADDEMPEDDPSMPVCKGLALR